MTYHTKENEVLDYICWKYYFQSEVDHLGLSQENATIEIADSIMEILNVGWTTSDQVSKLSKMVAMVIEANPGLTQNGVFLKANIPIELPDKEAFLPQQDTLQLWD